MAAPRTDHEALLILIGRCTEKEGTNLPLKYEIATSFSFVKRFACLSGKAGDDGRGTCCTFLGKPLPDLWRTNLDLESSLVTFCEPQTVEVGERGKGKAQSTFQERDRHTHSLYGECVRDDERGEGCAFLWAYLLVISGARGEIVLMTHFTVIVRKAT